MPTPAHRWARRNPIIAGFLTLGCFGMLGGYGLDIRSCQRTQETRRIQAINLPIFARVLLEDATRATDYSAIDPNARGVTINANYAAKRRADVAKLVTPTMVSCFPIPGT